MVSERLVAILDWRLIFLAAAFALLPLLHLPLATAFGGDMARAAKSVVVVCQIGVLLFLAAVPITGVRMVTYHEKIDYDWALESEVVDRGFRDILPCIFGLGLSLLCKSVMHWTILAPECDVFGATAWFCR